MKPPKQEKSACQQHLREDRSEGREASHNQSKARTHCHGQHPLVEVCGSQVPQQKQPTTSLSHELAWNAPAQPIHGTRFTAHLVSILLPVWVCSLLVRKATCMASHSVCFASGALCNHATKKEQDLSQRTLNVSISVHKLFLPLKYFVVTIPFLSKTCTDNHC